MRVLSRTILRELVVTALLGAVLFTFLIFLLRARPLFEFLVRSAGPQQERAPRSPRVRQRGLLARIAAIPRRRLSRPHCCRRRPTWRTPISRAMKSSSA